MSCHVRLSFSSGFIQPSLYTVLRAVSDQYGTLHLEPQPTPRRAPLEGKAPPKRGVVARLIRLLLASSPTDFDAPPRATSVPRESIPQLSWRSVAGNRKPSFGAMRSRLAKTNSIHSAKLEEYESRSRTRIDQQEAPGKAAKEQVQ